jgi:hypothetical protein
MRLTTDTPKNNLEMELNLFYVKDKEVWVRGYGKNGADISLFDLSRDLTRWNCPYVDLDISDDSFSTMMAEWLWEDVESLEHVLALLYQAAWVCAELREHLKQFEDMGISPQACAETREIEETLSGWDYSISRMVELMKADVEGRVVVLPCKVGDTVWRIKRTFETYPDKSKPYIEPDAFLLQDVFNIGKNVFLTREEAEKALRETQGKEDADEATDKPE